MTGTDAAVTYSASLIDRAHGSLIGGLIGDAMGTPSEGLEPEEIEAGFGWIEDFQGDGTDNSIMKYLLADALIATDGNADANSWATQWLAQRSKIGGAMSDRFFASILHAAAKLSYGVLPRRVALGHMPSLDGGDVHRAGRHRQCRPPPCRRRADPGDRQPCSCR